MDLYKHIRQLYAVEGVSKREIARRLGISRNTVSKYCEGAALPWERKETERNAPVMTSEVEAFIHECLEEDKEAPRKQRHTSLRIYERLRDELGFKGAYSTVRFRMGQIRKNVSKAYIPLEFGPGEAAQVDWGTATVNLNGKRQEVHLFCIRLCFSCAPFVIAYPSEREEAFLEGHQMAFQYFNGVVKYCIYDNLKTAVKEGWGRHAREQKNFKAFLAHYALQAKFCNPSEGHEKGLVESLVGWIRRNVLVPVPKVKDFDELNHLLLARCQSYLSHTIKGRETNVGEELAIDRRELTTLPVKTYDVARLSEIHADYFATVLFDGNRYSVPVEFAGKAITVKGYGRVVKCYYRREEIATHERLYEKGRTQYQLAHYLSLLEKRPRAVENARPVRAANLSPIFWNYARLFADADRTMVQLLRLVVDHGADNVAKSIVKAQKADIRSIEVVRHYLNLDKDVEPLAITGPQVEVPDLGCYDLLLGGLQ